MINTHARCSVYTIKSLLIFNNYYFLPLTTTGPFRAPDVVFGPGNVEFRLCFGTLPLVAGVI